MTHKHTPAPWRATRDTDTRGNPTWRIDAPSVSLLAVLTYGTPGERAEGIHDAHLIAAAPELLETLRAVGHPHPSGKGLCWCSAEWGREHSPACDAAAALVDCLS